MTTYSASLRSRLIAEEYTVRELVRQTATALAAEPVSWRLVRLLLGKARAGAAEIVRVQDALATEEARVEAQRARDAERQAAEQYVPMVREFEEARTGEQP